jgi:hypothetical protein
MFRSIAALIRSCQPRKKGKQKLKKNKFFCAKEVTKFNERIET